MMGVHFSRAPSFETATRRPLFVCHFSFARPDCSLQSVHFRVCDSNWLEGVGVLRVCCGEAQRDEAVTSGESNQLTQLR